MLESESERKNWKINIYELSFFNWKSNKKKKFKGKLKFLKFNLIYSFKTNKILNNWSIKYHIINGYLHTKFFATYCMPSRV